MRVDITRTEFYQELEEEQRKLFFDYNQHKYIHNIDTLYYTIFIKNDCNGNEDFEPIVKEFDRLRQQIRKTASEVEFNGELYMTKRRFDLYGYCLTKPDMYDIFFCDYLPNSSTPRILVQLRSFGLWMNGAEWMIEESYMSVEKILSDYGLSISQVRENRIDYAYHTNAVQSPEKFYGDEPLNKHMLTSLQIYQKVGRIKKHSLTIDYFALGQRGSNNIFVRNYLKSKEVIDEGYKGFFIKYWRSMNMISMYDNYCLQKAYEHSSYNYIDIARLEFYLEYGSVQERKEEIKSLIDNENKSHQEIKSYTDEFMPAVTKIMNIEFQTKRKFYYTSDSIIPLLQTRYTAYGILKRLISIIDNRKLFLDYLTKQCLCFVKTKTLTPEQVDEGMTLYSDSNIQDWWKRLRCCKLWDSLDSDKQLIREYNQKINHEKMKHKTVKTIASNMVYSGVEKIDTNFTEDITDLLGSLNDNDVYDNKFAILEMGTGEVNRDIRSEYLEKYNLYKRKKYKAIKNRLQSEPSESIGKEPNK